MEAWKLHRAAQLVRVARDEAWSRFTANPDAFSKAEFESGKIDVDLQLTNVHGLLMGLAIENLLKATLVGRTPHRFRRDKTRGTNPTHDLLAYGRECCQSLTPRQEFLLERLSEIIRWGGRHPAPHRLKD
jgi:hypothetical protein